MTLEQVWFDVVESWFYKFFFLLWWIIDEVDRSIWFIAWHSTAIFKRSSFSSNKSSTWRSSVVTFILFCSCLWISCSVSKISLLIPSLFDCEVDDFLDALKKSYFFIRISSTILRWIFFYWNWFLNLKWTKSLPFGCLNVE